MKHITSNGAARFPRSSGDMSAAGPLTRGIFSSPHDSETQLVPLKSTMSSSHCSLSITLCQVPHPPKRCSALTFVTFWLPASDHEAQKEVPSSSTWNSGRHSGWFSVWLSLSMCEFTRKTTVSQKTGCDSYLLFSGYTLATMTAGYVFVYQ